MKTFIFKSKRYENFKINIFSTSTLKKLIELNEIIHQVTILLNILIAFALKPLNSFLVKTAFVTLEAKK